MRLITWRKEECFLSSVCHNCTNMSLRRISSRSGRLCSSLSLIVIVCAVLSITQWDHWSRAVQQLGPAARLLVQVVMVWGSLLIRYGVWLSTLIRDSPGSPSPKATASKRNGVKSKDREEKRRVKWTILGVKEFNRKHVRTADQKY